MTGELYDRIGTSYLATRRPDPRFACVISGALGDAESVVNVGAGAGAYEPPDCKVVAVEPSEVMIAQRPPGAAPVVRATAERLPFADDSFDAAMAVFSDHHWQDRERGLRELARVARRRVVVFNMDPAEHDRFWLTAEYLPEFPDMIEARYRVPGAWMREFEDAWGNATLIPVPIPHDCSDGFYGAFWRRPEAYLDPVVRAGISVFSSLPADVVELGIARLQDDLRTGVWHERHAALLELPELDLGYAVVVAELGSG